MMAYQAEYTPLFEKSLKRYQNMRRRIRRRVEGVVQDPYAGTEHLGRVAGGKDLRGCRSIRVTRSFRIIFVVCEKCRRVPECKFCFCEGLPDKTVVFLAVGPHERAYAVREELLEYEAEAGVKEETAVP
jgi:mRNA-degrading endonuclease RelE of RelBE toxin-antitoxin system